MPADNPLREGLFLERRPDPLTLVIFGATGDLCHRKLLPALYNLMTDHWLPHEFVVLGVSRQELSNEEFRAEAKRSVAEFSRRPLDEEVWGRFSRNLFYLPGDFTQSDTFARLREEVERHARTIGTDNRLFYLATLPRFFPTIAEQLGEAGLNRTGDPTEVRLIVEKPFGHDLDSARALNQRLTEVFDESQIYRIDHYLGKETVQNIVVFRFANGIFEPIWNREYIDNVQITVAESIGIGGRGAYYDQAGAIRDMVQNHMLQLLSLIAMEPPIAFEADAIRDEKVKLLRAVRQLNPREVNEYTVRGQYGDGFVDGKPVPGYLSEPDVAEASRTESFVALRLLIDNWRWAGVPFFLRTGKRLAKRSTEIVIQFKRVPHRLFHQTDPDLEPNVLTLKIQPEEGIALRFGAKIPGPRVAIRTVNMEFLYGTSFADASLEAYERLLLDAMLGDSTLFTRRDEVEFAWELVTAIVNGWERMHTPVAAYEAGSWGPSSSDALLAREHLRWHRP